MFRRFTDAERLVSLQQYMEERRSTFGFRPQEEIDVLYGRDTQTAIVRSRSLQLVFKRVEDYEDHEVWMSTHRPPWTICLPSPWIVEST